MAIEKMTFVHASGPAEELDAILALCLRSGLFQPEHASRLSEYSVGASPLSHNPYGGLMTAFTELADRLGLEPGDAEAGAAPLQPENREASIAQASEYIKAFAKRFPRYYEQRRKLSERATFLEAALQAIRKADRSLARPMAHKHRFGRMDRSSFERFAGESNVLLIGEQREQVWLMVAASNPQQDEALRLAGFERVRLHDPPHEVCSSDMEYFEKGLVRDCESVQKTIEKINQTIQEEQTSFVKLAHGIRFLYDAFDLRKYAVLIRNQFHLIGFVLTRKSEAFLEALDPLPETISLALTPAQKVSEHIATPVKLRNNWLVRPFEMFVTMYGTPSYNDIDPSPFVAYTYCLLFGLMFGDVGQGLCMALLGIFLHRRKGMALGGVMSRIGVSSMVFGTLFGSVFGFEHALDWFYVGILGLHEKPIEVMGAGMTNQILIAAIALGCAIIVLAIVFNIFVGIKQRNAERILLSHNGLPGLLFYGSALLAVALRLLADIDVLKSWYVLPLFVLPLLVMFFKEPLANLMELSGKDSILQKHRGLQNTSVFQKIDVDLTTLFEAEFISSRFGRIPTHSYEKLAFYSDEPFIIHPIKSDRDYIWCVYAMAENDEQQVDAIFHDLFFERIFIPQEELGSLERTEKFIRRCMDSEGYLQEIKKEDDPVPVSRRRTVFQHMFPDGFGGFFAQSFFEMFEVLLSFVTNTMSFLRVGGFILCHAGMMSVVFTLSAMAGAGATPLVLVIGNLFVMGLEGLIVGIQALRLEFYEIFSRFFDANGEPFVPIQAGEAFKAA